MSIAWITNSNEISPIKRCNLLIIILSVLLLKGYTVTTVLKDVKRKYTCIYIISRLLL